MSNFVGIGHQSAICFGGRERVRIDGRSRSGRSVLRQIGHEAGQRSGADERLGVASDPERERADASAPCSRTVAAALQFASPSITCSFGSSRGVLTARLSPDNALESDQS